MSDHECIRIFDSQGPAYKEAFQIFLGHTDQKRNARRWLQQSVRQGAAVGLLSLRAR